MNVGTLFRAQALKNVFGGDALARVQNEVVLVPGVIAGEEFVAEVTRVHRDYARASVRELLTVSPDRVTPGCPDAGHCPGCAYMHFRHAAEQRAKLEQLRGFLAPFLPAEAVLLHAGERAPAEGYRNKIKLVMRKSGGLPKLGYTAPDGGCYEIRQCRLACAAINEKLAELCRDPGFFHTLHDGMTLTLRAAADTVAVFRNQSARRLPFLHETVLGRDFLVPAAGFFQVNPAGLAALIELLQEVLREVAPTHFIDAYAGAGLFGAVAAAAGVPRLSGVELDSEAARAAERNWRNFGAKEFTFHAGDSAEVLPKILRERGSGALLVLDPPRGGMDPAMARTVARAQTVRAAVYISCHPATLTRDLAVLSEAGLHPVWSRMVDMFPRSGHMESFTFLRRAC